MNWSESNRLRPRLAACLLVLLMLSPVQWGIAADLPGGGQQQEYFVRQNANEGLLVRIDGREAQFEATIATTDGEVLVASGLPGIRVAPLFQYVTATPDERQLDIRVSAPFDTNRTRFDLGLSRITIRDDRSRRLARAYQLLSFGLELPPADTTANWSIKVGSLDEAARGFESFGMDALYSWSRYFSARLTFTGLGDNVTALGLANALLTAPGARRDPAVRLAALRLRADVLAALRGAGELPDTGSEVDPVQSSAQAAANLAASLGLLFERADALYLAGRDLVFLGRNEEALERFTEALELADTIESADLATAVRERLVEIHGQQGDVAATSEVLQAIESQLTEDGANDELAQNLLAQGRILNRTYRYENARAVLRQALDFEHNSATRNQVRLALAEASWALGDLVEARAQARAAVINPESGRWRRPTAVLDVQKGLGILAGVARESGERTELNELRASQERMLANDAERTRWVYDRALDELADGGRATAAVPFLRQARDSANASETGHIAELSRLWLCALGSDCPAGTTTRARDALRARGIPRYQVKGDWLAARIALRAGRAGESARALEGVVGDMSFLRFSVPGVLGSVYWRYIDGISSDLLAARRATGRDDLLLMDLARLRWLRASGAGRGMPFNATVAGLDTDAFRALLARRETPEAQDQPAALAQEIRGHLTTGRGSFDEETPFLESAALGPWLEALEPGAAVLDFDLGGSQAIALVGTASGVRRYALGPASRLADWPAVLDTLPAMDSVRFDAAMVRWGERLLAPLVADLPGRVYLASGDALAFLPFEAFRLPGGARFGETRSLVRLASFPARPAPARRLAGFEANQIFVAGSPVDYRAGFLARLETGAELRAVMDRFLGPGLQVIQGSALAADEFSTDLFRNADLLHLAMPTRINTSLPARSYLELSEPLGGAGRVQVTAAELRDWRMNAHLAVFSQSALATPVRPAAGRPPLVAGILAAGAGAVLASAWIGSDEASAAFFGAFYDGLARGEALDVALMNARRAPAVPDGWPRFQLWVE